MRTIPVLGILLLAGCAAAATEQPREPILRPGAEILHAGGTSNPVKSAVKGKTVRITHGRAPCQTNDPMPTGNFGQPPARTLNVHPLRVAPMPNYCPVTVPLVANPVPVRGPIPRKTVPKPTPLEPRP